MKPRPHTLKILHLDDDPFEIERVAKCLKGNELGQELSVTSTTRLDEFRHLLHTVGPDIVMLDIHIGDSLQGGIPLVQETRSALPHAVILMCSGMDDVSTIAECLQEGADDFLSKRSDRHELNLRVLHSYELARLKRGIPSEVASSMKPQGAGMTFERLATRVPLILQSAVSAVHLEGESGTGKEVAADLFASLIPKGMPFVKVNCGAIAPTLLESELFGHVRGAFTGAIGDKKGLLESAAGGWIFLDEVTSLSPSAQVALLRVLENRELRRVGANQTIPVEVRVISAANEPLRELVKQGKFRQDLWQRLCETEIHLPALSERTEEIPVLVAHFCRIMPGGPYTITEPALEVLSGCSWKSGNIRELRNTLRAMTELHVNRLLTPLSIPERVWKSLDDRGASADAPVTPSPSAPVAFVDMGGISSELVLRVSLREPIHFDTLTDLLLLELTRGLTAKSGKMSLRKLAKAIGISRSTLSGRLKGLTHKNLVDLKELTQLVGVGEEGP